MDIATHKKNLAALATDLRAAQEANVSSAQSNAALTHAEQAGICLDKHAAHLAAKESPAKPDATP